MFNYTIDVYFGLKFLFYYYNHHMIKSDMILKFILSPIQDRNMAKIMVIGPLTRDIIVKNDSVYQSIGGAVYYQTAVLSQLEVGNTAVMTLAEKDRDLTNNFPQQTDIFPIYTSKTMEFENIYPNQDPNHRIQKANIPKNPIKPHSFPDIDFEVFNALLLCPLSPFDIPISTLEYLYQFKIPIYLGAQGYMRHMENNNVVLKPWKDYKQYLKFVKLLFIDETEARVILGVSEGDCGEIAQILSGFGPEEVIITRGNQGALIYARRSGNSDSGSNKDGIGMKISDKEGDGDLYDIPAFPPQKIVDPTGLGDTFMAAYAAWKLETDDPEECGIVASLVSSHKMGRKGAFQGDRSIIQRELNVLLSKDKGQD